MKKFSVLMVSLLFSLVLSVNCFAAEVSTDNINDEKISTYAAAPAGYTLVTSTRLAATPGSTDVGRLNVSGYSKYAVTFEFYNPNTSIVIVSAKKISNNHTTDYLTGTSVASGSFYGPHYFLGSGDYEFSLYAYPKSPSPAIVMVRVYGK